jgi:hypothetical protein
MPGIFVCTGITSSPAITFPIVSPACTASAIPLRGRNTPAAGEWITRSAPYPATIPGTPVLGIAHPESIIRPRSCPRMVSMT